MSVFCECVAFLLYLKRNISHNIYADTGIVLIDERHILTINIYLQDVYFCISESIFRNWEPHFSDCRTGQN